MFTGQNLPDRRVPPLLVVTDEPLVEDGSPCRDSTTSDSTTSDSTISERACSPGVFSVDSDHRLRPLVGTTACVSSAPKLLNGLIPSVADTEWVDTKWFEGCCGKKTAAARRLLRQKDCCHKRLLRQKETPGTPTKEAGRQCSCGTVEKWIGTFGPYLRFKDTPRAQSITPAHLLHFFFLFRLLRRHSSC